MERSAVIEDGRWREKRRRGEEFLTRGFVSERPGRPCLACASVGRLTWLDDDGTCRRADAHKGVEWGGK